MQFFVGTSGFSYKEWKGSFYPEKLPQQQMLSYYAEQFGTVELNNTFRRMPTEIAMRSWACQTPSNFRFAIKAPQSITHFKRLRDVEEPTKELFHLAGVLKARLGPVLFGLPTNMKKDLARLKAFLRVVPKKRQAAIEFRHDSWFDDEVFECLRLNRCVMCVTDDEDLPLAPLMRTSNWGYIRLRRTNYTKKSLSNWIRKANSIGWEQAYVFFKHENTGTGPKLANRFLELAKR